MQNVNIQTNATVVSIEEIRIAAKAKIAAKLAQAKIDAEVKLLQSDAFLDAQVNQALRDQTTEKLVSFIDQCTAIVSTNPVINRTLKKDREFNLSKRYGLGNQFALLSGLLSGIQFSVQEHSDLMLEITGLSPDLIETTLQHMGSLPYYSANNNVVVSGNVGSADALKANLMLIESILGATIDKSMITQANLQHQHDMALAKAEKAEAEMKLAATVQSFIIQ
jgi:hypothetical protein